MLIPAVSRTIVTQVPAVIVWPILTMTHLKFIIDHPEDLGLELLQRTQILSLLQVRDKMVNTFSLIS